MAHFLGNVMDHEALHAHPDLHVYLLVTLGSPLAPGSASTAAAFRSIPSLEIEGASGSCPRDARGGALVS
jgi:hypothetical protein